MSSTPLERLRSVVGRQGAIARVHVAFGSVLDAVEPGRAVARLPALPPPTLRGPGVVPVLGDLALSAAILATLPAGLGIATLTLHTTMLGPLPPPGEPLVVAAEFVGGPGSALAGRGDARAADGRLVAHLTCCCAVMSRAEGPSGAAGRPDPDPFAVLGPDLHADPSLANAGGGVQGGVLAAILADRMAGEADADVADLDVTFLRGVAADGAPMAVATESIHAGRRLAAARASLSGADDRPAAVATCAFWTG
jgi:acyl-coenzyme A thioesterase PaaI-like protein